MLGACGAGRGPLKTIPFRPEFQVPLVPDQKVFFQTLRSYIAEAGASSYRTHPHVVSSLRKTRDAM